MKKHFSITFVFILLTFQAMLFAQADDPNAEKKPLGAFLGQRLKSVTLDCHPINLTECSYINNKTFDHPPPYDPIDYFSYAQPFNLGLIPNWSSSHGDAIVWDGINWTAVQPPFLNAGHSWMGVHANFPNWNPQTGGEGIAQKIPVLVNGHTYGFSFFRKAGSIDQSIETTLDLLDIFLLRCSDNSFNPNSSSNPSIPLISKHVYCETSVSNLNGWQQIFITFTIDRSDYNMIWVYPKEVDNGILFRQSGLFFSFPELIDITNFSAGMPPNPTPINCTVTLGPTIPNCGVQNSIYTWHGPNGQIIPAPQNQQIQVDANNSQNVGLWTLTMTVPTASNTNNTCSQTQNISATVNVPSCVSAPWPKSYASWNDFLLKDKFGNIFTYYSGGDIRTNINHSGILPTNSGDYTVQYNSTTGVSTWVRENLAPFFTLSSGSIQMISTIDYATMSFYNSSTGQPTASPALVPANEKIIAELSNNGFITTGNNNINVHLSSGSSSTSFIPLSTSILKSFFNPSSLKLFIEYYNSSTFYSTLAVYQLIGANLVLLNNPSFSDYPGIITTVNNNDIVYTWGNGYVLNQYDYINKIKTPLSIPGFNNNNIITYPFTGGRGSYTEDQILLVKFDEKRIYSTNTSTNEFKKIDFNFSPIPNYTIGYYYYIYSGTDVYLSGVLDGTSGGNLVIGGQSIFVYPNQSSFITKFDLLGDFNRPTQQKLVVINNKIKSEESKNIPSEESEQIRISPNPANSQVTITAGKSPIRFIQIADIYNNIVLRKNSGDSKNITFSVVNLLPGVYYCSIITINGIINKKIVVIK